MTYGGDYGGSNRISIHGKVPASSGHAAMRNLRDAGLYRRKRGGMTGEQSRCLKLT